MLLFDIKISIKSITLSLPHHLKRAIRVRSHSFDTLGVPKKAGGVAGQRPKVSKYLKQTNVRLIHKQTNNIFIIFIILLKYDHIFIFFSLLKHWKRMVKGKNKYMKYFTIDLLY